MRVTSKNARTWTVFYRNKNGRQKRLTLGRYAAVKLVDARELARVAVRRGADESARVFIQVDCGRPEPT